MDIIIRYYAYEIDATRDCGAGTRRFENGGRREARRGVREKKNT